MTNLLTCEPPVPPTYVTTGWDARRATVAVTTWSESERSPEEREQLAFMPPLVTRNTDVTEGLPEFDHWRCGVIVAHTSDLLRHTQPAARAEIQHFIDVDFVGDLRTRGLDNLLSYEQQNDGDLVQNLIPRPGKEHVQGNSGRVSLPEHTDDAVLAEPFRAENLTLCGVDNPAAVPTVLVPLPSVLKLLPAATVDLLLQARYRFACPETFELPGREPRYSADRSVLYEDRQRLRIRFASYSTTARPGDELAAQAIVELKQAIAAADRTSLVLRGGDIVTFSNSLYLHSRGAVESRRWLKRAYSTSSVRALEQWCRTDRPHVYDADAALQASLPDMETPGV